MTETASAEESTPTNYIIGTSQSTMTSDIYSCSVSNQAPFDTSTKTMMSGLSFVPTYNTNYEATSKNYSVNEFEISNDGSQSIFMWIYLPDSPNSVYFDLYIKFYNSDGEYAEWSLDYDELGELCRNYNPYSIMYVGWKLFEFSLVDATSNFNSSTATLDNLNISYKLNENYTEYEYYYATDYLTIYSAYVGNSTNTKTIINNSLNYYYYYFSGDFTSSIKGLYTGDKVTISSISSVFSYVYVGKSNLTLSGTQNNSFSWDISYNDGSETSVITLPQTLYFDNSATCSLCFELTEYKNSASTGTTVFSAKYSFNIFSFVFGSFEKSSFEIQKGSSLIIQFSFSDNFTQISGVSFSVDDEKTVEIAEITYSSSLGIYYIELKGLKKGTASIVATATGYRENSNEVETSYSATSSVSITYSGISEWMSITIYVFLGLYLLAFVIFVIISFVNVRKNIVK